MSELFKFRKRPVVEVEVEAMQFSGENQQEIEQAFTSPDSKSVFHWDLARPKARLLIWSPEGLMSANPGDWIVRSNGVFSVCECDVFAATYESVS